RATPGIGQDAQLRSSARLWCTRSAVRAPFELQGPSVDARAQIGHGGIRGQFGQWQADIAYDPETQTGSASSSRFCASSRS
ncbi:hypothetical protein VB636_00700, partial [Paracoccus sp. APAP_BH8]|uniref:hypothetical protein n=1 Tax=Paracoccus sp. APAP_BH8 TaxID=3110237 RepID=UPI002FD87BB1